MQWYYEKDGEQIGPISEANFQALVDSKTISKKTLVWNAEMPDWVHYDEIPLADKPAAQPSLSDSETRCSMCGTEADAGELIEFENAQICAACKPAFVQQMQENAEFHGINTMRYAGFWRRWGALIIDGFVVMPLTIPLGIGYNYSLAYAMKAHSVGFGVLTAALYILMLLIPLTYYSLMIGKCGATVGKKAVGVKVVMSDGSPLTMGRAIGRAFAFMLSGMILYIGYIMAGFDEQKRALHDHICNTRVIFVR